MTDFFARIARRLLGPADAPDPRPAGVPEPTGGEAGGEAGGLAGTGGLSSAGGVGAIPADLPTAAGTAGTEPIAAGGDGAIGPGGRSGSALRASPAGGASAAAPD